jgi:hypothetical protein
VKLFFVGNHRAKRGEMEKNLEQSLKNTPCLTVAFLDGAVDIVRRCNASCFGNSEVKTGCKSRFEMLKTQIGLEFKTWMQTTELTIQFLGLC